MMKERPADMDIQPVIPASAPMILQLHCAQCPATGKLLRCSRCRMTRYCCKKHQAADWPNHKKQCSLICKMRDELLDEEENVRRMTRFDPVRDEEIDIYAFDEEVGHFGDMPETHQYIRFRGTYVHAVLGVKSYDAVTEAIEHVKDCLRLDRRDMIGLRGYMAGLFLRIGQDQECYDFIKYWQLIELNVGLDGWDDDMDGWFDQEESPACFDEMQEDMFEDVDDFCDWLGDYPLGIISLSHIVAVTLIKLRLLFTVQKCLEQSDVLRESNKLPPEIYDGIEQAHLAMTLGAKWRDRKAPRASDLLKTLSSQIDMLYKAVREQNNHFWPRLASGTHNHPFQPLMDSPACIKNAHVLLMFNAESWKETPGAVDFIKAKVKKEGDEENEHDHPLELDGDIFDPLGMLGLASWDDFIGR